jgi:tetratricopeptide (TPR) repeat protein
MSRLRDHALSGLAGVLVGFVAAYFLFESVAERQPQRRAFHADGEAAAAPAPGGGPAAGGPGSGGAVRAPFMERVGELEREIAAAPDDPAPRLRLAALYFDAGLWPQAEQAYGRYLEGRPDDPDAMIDLGVALYQQGRFEDALARFRRVREIAPDHFQARFNEALVLAFGLRRFDEAEALVEELRRLRPGDPEVERLAAGIAEGKGAA